MARSERPCHNRRLLRAPIWDSGLRVLSSCVLYWSLTIQLLRFDSTSRRVEGVVEGSKLLCRMIVGRGVPWRAIFLCCQPMYMFGARKSIVE